MRKERTPRPTGQKPFGLTLAAAIVVMLAGSCSGSKGGGDAVETPGPTVPMIWDVGAWDKDRWQ